MDSCKISVFTVEQLHHCTQFVTQYRDGEMAYSPRSSSPISEREREREREREKVNNHVAKCSLITRDMLLHARKSGR